MPKFVILRHEPGPQSDRSLHWDLMLESEHSLKTWALPAEPANTGTMLAEALPDHRKDYLDYEGPLSGERGEVTRWDSGSYEFEQRGEKEFTVRLCGIRVPALVSFKRRDVNPASWTVEFQSATGEDSKASLD